MSFWQPLNRFSGVIDVSRYQGKIDWRGVAGAGIALAFIKATQGDVYRDPSFAANCDGATANGVMVVPYHFLTEASVDDQIANLRAATGFARPVMVDWEEDPAVARRPPVATMEAFCAAARSATGRDPVAYHGMYDLTSPMINAYPWMVPKWGPMPQGPKWLFWQDTASANIPGVLSSGEDHSWFAGTHNEMAAWWRDGTLPAGFELPSGPQAADPAYLTLVLALEKPERELIQIGLEAEGGLYRGKIDGIIGPLSRAALAGYHG